METKFKVEKYKLFVVALLFSAISTCLIMPGIIAAIMCVGIIIVIAIIGYNAYIKGNSKTIALVCTLPIFFASVQNIYLGISVYLQTSLSLQILLSLHFLLVVLSIMLNYRVVMNKAKWGFNIVALILLQSFLLFIIYPVPITALISSLRNILSCVLIYLFALSFGRKFDKVHIYKIILIIAWFVVIFGLFEYCVGFSIWKQLGITHLWKLKGITTNVAGIPKNWYSSEKIAGHQLRRMVSSFADPVNLGTYLFASFMVAWYKKKKLLSVMCIICCILTVSKGALLGFFIFIVVNAWFKDKTKLTVPLFFFFSLVGGVGFVQYSMTSSTGSMMAHVNGFINSLNVLITNPLGLGIGNVGVLAGLFSTSLSNAQVVETGIGVIIAQLGWIGLISYFIFFLKLFKEPNKWCQYNLSALITYYTLLITYIINVAFNEVALSPNSCALYFIEFAILNSSMCEKIFELN